MGRVRSAAPPPGCSSKALSVPGFCARPFRHAIVGCKATGSGLRRQQLCAMIRTERGPVSADPIHKLCTCMNMNQVWADESGGTLHALTVISMERHSCGCTEGTRLALAHRPARLPAAAAGANPCTATSHGLPGILAAGAPPSAHLPPPHFGVGRVATKYRAAVLEVQATPGRKNRTSFPVSGDFPDELMAEILAHASSGFTTALAR